MGDHLMPVDYRFSRGVDLPSWHWLSVFPNGPSYHGTGNAYDGERYIYWAVQYGTTATTASTTQLWRFCTWTNGWQFLATLTSGNRGVDVEWDAVRRVVIVSHGSALTSWQVYNPNTTAVTVAGVSIAAQAVTTMTPVLPAAANEAASLTMPDDLSVTDPLDTGTAAIGSTSTTLIETSSTSLPGTFAQGMVGLVVRWTSGTLSGQRRVVTSVTSATTLVTAAFTAAPAVGDAFVVELPNGTATAGTTTTLSTGLATTANVWRDSDVIITAGTGAGQRRRIGSHDAAGVLTLAAAVTGNPRTGPFTTAPDATSVFRIVPSSDFLYYAPGGSTTTFYRLDVVANPAATWTTLTAMPGTLGGGGNVMAPAGFAPFSLLTLRGNTTRDLYLYSVGLNTWQTLASHGGQDTITSGAAACLLHGRRRLFVQKEGQGRCYAIDLTTGVWEPAGVLPYANPSTYDGHRARFVRTSAGVEWVYLMRSGGQEFYRVPIEWMS